ncbi:ComEA family DNA-binding protein [Actinomadura parmotrematis]|uniref:ComEA family DNA-binding protein n=1 Tax=Actinomadura parmotrematis TaxID=2864039 RepID=A0ABS7FV54_9ACTN|nr:ComEA family DNA-binding protein [Actinomadura parmotrematis]MBW8483564.1 ComEA family DNA-binding protein [Actinomadura parmotrematis]
MTLTDRLRRPGTFGTEPPLVRLRSGPEPPDPPGPLDTTSRPLPIRPLVLIAAIAVLAAGFYVWQARPSQSASVIEPAAASAAPPSEAAPAGTSSTDTPAGVPSLGAGTTPPGTVLVHVLGKVRHPGVVTLPTGSRVSDAIQAAGGVRPNASTGTLNLARKLADGEQIPVGIPPPPQQAAPPATSPPGSPASGASAPGTPLSLSTATADQLDQLPGVGPVLAQRIVEYRTQHGPFRSVDQLQEVTGIGARRFADLRPLIAP